MATLLVDANQMCRPVIGQESERGCRASLRAARALVHQQHLQEAEELCVEALTRMAQGPALGRRPGEAAALLGEF